MGRKCHCGFRAIKSSLKALCCPKILTMIAGFNNSIPEMAAIWTDEKKFECWLAVELAADEAWAKLGFHF